jgi:hypothetical protein
MMDIAFVWSINSMQRRTHVVDLQKWQASSCQARFDSIEGSYNAISRLRARNELLWSACYARASCGNNH